MTLTYLERGKIEGEALGSLSFRFEPPFCYRRNGCSS